MIHIKKKEYDFKGASSYHKEWSTRVFDIIGEPLSVFLIKCTKMTPNQCSMLSFIFGLVGGIFFLQGGFINQVIGASFAFLYNIFDMIDGRIARARHISTKMGKWLDAIIDFFVFPYLIFTLAYGMGTYMAALVGMLAIISYNTHYLIVFFYKFEMTGNKPIGIPGKGKLEWIRYIYGSNVFYLVLLITVLLKAPMAVLWIWAIFGNLYWMAILVVQYQNLRRFGLDKHG